MRIKHCIILLMSSQVLLVSGQGKVPEADLSLSAKAALQELERTVQLAKQKAVEKLKLAMKNEMQMGRLDRANRINQEILKLSEVPVKGTSEIREIIDGEWKLANGTVVTFKQNGEVEWGGDSWYGTWKIDGQKVNILLDKRHGYNQVVAVRFSCDLPAKKLIGNQDMIVMQAQPGVENFTLYRKE